MQRPYYRGVPLKTRPTNATNEMSGVNPAQRAGGVPPGYKSDWANGERNNQPVTVTNVDRRRVYQAPMPADATDPKAFERNTLATIPPANLDQKEVSSPTTTDHFHHRESIWRVIIDVISLAILLGVILVSYFIATPFTRGFSCADTTIKYPYKTDTIPTYAAVALSLGLPLVWMLITEICKTIYFYRSKRERYRIHLEFPCCKSLKIPPIIRNLYMLAIIFAYGYLTTWMFVEISKNFIGRLRPHFLAVCQPSFNCAGVTLFEQFHSVTQFGANLTCLNNDTSAVREARRSFISGHTAPMFYGCGFLIMYIHISWSWRHLGVLPHVLQTGLAVLACYVGFTRIMDYHHHWEDVLASGIVGSLVAFAAFRFILNWTHYNPEFLPYAVTRGSPYQNNARDAPYTRLASSSSAGDHQGRARRRD